MNTLNPWQQKKENTPPCFGKQWNEEAPECAGGPDPAYTDKDGSHVRERCNFFYSCGAQVNARRVIPASSLVQNSAARPATPTPAVAAPQPTPSFQAWSQQREIQLRQEQQTAAALAQQQAAFAQQQAMLTAQKAAAVPMPYITQAPMPQMQYPAPQYQLNYMVPGYLTVPEPRQADTSFWGLLGREAARSIGKALGHTIANFFDSNPLRMPPKE